jgi:hypothetical protein
MEAVDSVGRFTYKDERNYISLLTHCRNFAAFRGEPILILKNQVDEQ